MIYSGNKNLKMRNLHYTFYIEINSYFSLKKQVNNGVLLVIE